MRTSPAFLRHGGALLALAAIPFLIASCSDEATDDGGAGSPGVGGTAPTAGTAGSAGKAAGGAAGSATAGTGGTAGTGTGGTAGKAGTGGASGGGAGGAGGVAAGAGTGGVATGGSSGAPGGAGAGGAAGSSTSGGAGGATGGGGAGGATGGAPQGGSTGGGGTSGGVFAVTSPDHEDNAKFGTDFTCAANNGMFGSGVNPELNWTGVPAGTMSFAITFIDTKLGEDSAMGQHWAAWDIPADVVQLPKGTTAFSGELAGAKQTNKYLSPCPSGDDTYAFTIYALPTATLAVMGNSEGTGVANSAGVARVIAALRAATPLGTAVLRGTSGPMGE